MTLAQLRKELKLIGFKIKLETFSFGKHGKFTDSDGKAVPSIFFGEEHRQQFMPLFNYLNVNHERLVEFSKEHKIVLSYLTQQTGATK